MDFATLAHLRDHSKWTGLYRLLLIEIELFATGTSHTSYPGIDTLAQHLGKTPRHTQQLLRTLITAGAVKVVRGGGRHRTNTYQLCDLPDETRGEEAETPQTCVDGDVCGLHHQPGLCGINAWDGHPRIPETVNSTSGFSENGEMDVPKPRNRTHQNPEAHFTRSSTEKERKERVDTDLLSHRREETRPRDADSAYMTDVHALVANFLHRGSP
jgi:hypothetical protein